MPPTIFPDYHKKKSNTRISTELLSFLVIEMVYSMENGQVVTEKFGER